MSNIINIFHFDDQIRVRTNVDTYIIAINEEYKEQGIPLEIMNEQFDNTEELIKKLKQKHTPQIIILDMYEGTKNVGEIVLNTVKELRLKIPTIIYTQGSIDDYPIQYDAIIKENPFVFGNPILKSTAGHELKERIKDIIESKYLQNNYSLFDIDEDDILLKAEIRSIGEQNLNKILIKVRHHLAFNGKFVIERMSSGFSGAAVFKLVFDKKIKVLKISNNKDKLKKEHENSRKLYNEFPSRFRIHINPAEEKILETEQSYAILIENVHSSNTLFDWLKTAEKNIVNSFFNDFYSKENGLEYFYKNHIEQNGKVKFVQIFETFITNYALVATVIKELHPIVDHFKDIFFPKNIKNLVLNGYYEKLDKNTLLGERYSKNKILCHGDFHSKNIMIQSSHNIPIIIDTGGIKYDYWCMDICRLIVHLFIVGFDEGTVQYFDIAKISENLCIAKKIINLESIDEDKNNDKNNGYIYAINWLINNVPTIYGDLYCRWEFQLGLCKEFLQASYRINSTPPNKRALSLLAAYQCMLAANESVE